MYVEKHLSEDDLQRAHDKCPQPVPATLLAGSYCCLLEAIDIFTQDLVNKVTTGLLNPSPRETVLIGFYYRSLGYCRTAIELKSVVHQQSLTSAERSVVELYVDMELIHRNVVADGVEKAIAFADVQKLKAAHRMDDFFAANPGLDSNPSKAATHRDFIAKNQARIEKDIERLWGKNAKGQLIKPEHWSGMDLITRATKLDKDIEYLVVKDYDRRNFYVHTGLAGVLNRDKGAFESLCAFALHLIADCMLGELRILGKEFQLEKVINEYDKALQEIEKVQTYAFADKVLQSLGEPSRYSVFKGDKPIVRLA